MKKQVVFFILSVLFFCFWSCTKEKIVAVKHINVDVHKPSILTNFYNSEEVVIFTDYNPKSIHFKEANLRITYTKYMIRYSGDSSGMECSGGGNLSIYNNTNSSMMVTYQLGNIKETITIKPNNSEKRDGFEHFCDQPDLQILSFEYL